MHFTPFNVKTCNYTLSNATSIFQKALMEMQLLSNPKGKNASSASTTEAAVSSRGVWTPNSNPEYCWVPSREAMRSISTVLDSAGYQTHNLSVSGQTLY